MAVWLDCCIIMKGMYKCWGAGTFFPTASVSRFQGVLPATAPTIKISIIEVYLLKYYFRSHLIYTWHYYRQTIPNQLNIMVSYVDIIGLRHSFAILWEIYVMRHKFYFKRMLITRPGQYTLQIGNNSSPATTNPN